MSEGRFTAAGRPLPVLAAAVLIAAGVVVAAMALLPRLATLLVWPPAMLEALFALLLFGTLALAGWAGRRLAGIARAVAAMRAPAAIGVGLAIGIGGFLLALGDAALAGTVSKRVAGGTIGLLLLGTAVTVGQSAAEELFFRGWLQPVLARGWGDAAAVLVTAAAFAALHVAGGARSGLTLANLFLGGVLFGLLTIRSGGLLAPMAAHAGWNWSEAILFGLEPNPGGGSFGAVTDLDLVGAGLWGGSAEGINASIAMTLVLCAFIVPLATGARGWRFSARRVPG